MKTFFPAAAVMILTIALFASCTSDAVTDSLAIQYTKVEITTEESGGSTTVNANITVRLINRTEKEMNVGFIEAEILSGNSDEALLRFRPIIPDAYGSISTVRLLPKETKEVPVVLPLGLKAWDLSKHPSARIGIQFQTTDGYRTNVHSNKVGVTSK